MELWGRRLSDAIRSAVDAGDITSASRMARQGDGQTRSLAKEYFLMIRGLRVTVSVIIDELRGATVRSSDPSGLVRGLRSDLLSLTEQVFDGRLVSVAGEKSLDPDAGCLSALDRVARRFEEEQEQLAALAIAALEEGRGTDALAILDRKESGQFLPLHDRLILFMAESFAFVYDVGGAQAVTEFQRRVAAGQRAGFDAWESMSEREFVRSFAFLLKQHLGQVSVREEPDRFVLEQSLCGSGGRLLAGGAYAGDGALPFVPTVVSPGADPVPMPAYCTHCPAWNTFAPIDWYGRPHLLFVDPARPDGGCTVHVPKRAAGQHAGGVDSEGSRRQESE